MEQTPEQNKGSSSLEKTIDSIMLPTATGMALGFIIDPDILASIPVLNHVFIDIKGLGIGGEVFSRLWNCGIGMAAGAGVGISYFVGKKAGQYVPPAARFAYEEYIKPAYERIKNFTVNR